MQGMHLLASSPVWLSLPQPFCESGPCAACYSTAPTVLGAASIPGTVRLADTFHHKQQDTEAPRTCGSRDYTSL